MLCASAFLLFKIVVQEAQKITHSVNLDKWFLYKQLYQYIMLKHNLLQISLKNQRECI